MGLLSIFQRNKQTGAKPAKASRSGKAPARQAPLANTPNPADSAEAVRDARARARRRLMGATVLLLVGVIGFPLLFETQPRPIPVDLPIEIPARNAAGGVDAAAPALHASRSVPNTAPLASNLGMPVMAASSATPESVSYDARPSAPVAAPSAAQAGSRSTLASIAAAFTSGDSHASEATRTSPVPVTASGVKPAASAAFVKSPSRPVTVAAAPSTPTIAPAHAPVVAPKPAAVPAPHVAADTPAAPEPVAANRFVVQVGAFADDNKLRDVRSKVEKIGLKTYTQAVDTPAGKRVRVRVGPYATKAEADKVAARIKSDGLPAAVLAL
jgi:DedD protein